MIRAACLAIMLVATPAGFASAQTQTPSSPPPEFGTTAPAADLADVRGGDGKVVYQAVTDQVLSATNSGNVVSASTVGSGAINFGQGATSGFSGLGNFVVNTGHNNNLQGAISVNILITPGK